MDTILLRVYKKRWKIFSNKVKRNKINSFKTRLDRSREIEKYRGWKYGISTDKRLHCAVN